MDYKYPERVEILKALFQNIVGDQQVIESATQFA